MDVLSPLSARNTTNSDDSEGLVTTIKRNTRAKDGASEEISMSGALAPEDLKDNPGLRPPCRRQRAALSRVAREADHVQAIKALKTRRGESVAKEGAPKLVAQEKKLGEAQDEVLVPSSMLRTEEIAQVGIETEEEQLDKRTVERVRHAPFSIRKNQATPGAEPSILALAKFKRRPRQPSILQIGRHDASASEDELDDLLDDFHPDDESTPFHMIRLEPTTQATPTHRASTHFSTILSSLDREIPSSRKRKLSLPSVQVPNSQLSPLRLSPSLLGPTNDQASDSHITREATLHESDPDLPPTRLRAPPAETIWSDTMALPESSSPPQSPAQSTMKNNPKIRYKQPTRRSDDKEAPTSALAISNSAPLKSISTAMLQNLLPRRRRWPIKRVPGDFDIPNSSDIELNTPDITEDEDELGLAPPIGRKRTIINSTRRATKPTKSTANVKTTADKALQTSLSKGPTDVIGVVKTYSRRLSDKENVNGYNSRGDDSNHSHLSTSTTTSDAYGDTGQKGGALPAKVKLELKTLAKKFREVDQWEMEFEEVTASSSSPWDAR